MKLFLLLALATSCLAAILVRQFFTQPRPTQSSEPPFFHIAFAPYQTTQFSLPSSLTPSTEIVLKWEKDNVPRQWGDVVDICLVGLDHQKQKIPLQTGFPTCYPDMQLNVAAVSASAGQYRWRVPQAFDAFTSPPASFQLSLRVIDRLPPDQRTEWAGLISESASSEFVLVKTQ